MVKSGKLFYINPFDSVDEEAIKLLDTYLKKSLLKVSPNSRYILAPFGIITTPVYLKSFERHFPQMSNIYAQISQDDFNQLKEIYRTLNYLVRSLSRKNIRAHIATIKMEILDDLAS
jgi:hypothetical protein